MLLARSPAVQCVAAATTGSFLPAGWWVLGRAGQGSPGSLEHVSAAGLAPRPCRGPPRRLRSTWVPLGARYHLRDSPSPVWHLQQPGDTRGGRSPWAAGAGAGLGLRLLGAVLQAATSGHLFLAPPGQGRACGGRQAPGLAGAEGYFWPRLLTRPATLSRSLPL